ncbi:hydrolase [Zoogloea sp.]|uniref:hydrolase n=1 Tax=Zoogloea sp. TaxID=49181 RepID=UPI0025EFA0E2|nr:hydrolase [Zoogloea sp.]MCK6393454.1 hydrolase [Zoogloea sp.]
MYKLKTLDVWDTLLRRKCHPDFIKLTAARHLQLRFNAHLTQGFADHWAIFRERCQIEGELARAAAKAGTDDEYSLHHVLEHLVQRVVSAPGIDAARVADELAAAELAIEKANTFPDPQCREVIGQYPAERTLFLSDFYMPAGMLNELLQHHGLDDIAADGISSCDIRLNKRSGQLFRHVHEAFALAPEHHVHIGDNAHSDVSIPGAIGIRSVHYLPEQAHAERELRESLFADRASLFGHLERIVSENRDAALEGREGDARAAFQLGTQAAPLWVGFCLSVAEQAVIHQFDRLFFFTREGEFFIQVFNRLFPHDSIAGLPLPPRDTLEVSRLATFCASLREVSTAELMRMWNLYSTQSMFALARSLGLEPAALEGLCSRHGLPVGEEVVYPWQDARIQALFADPDFQRLVGDKSMADAESLLAYIEQKGLAPSDTRIGIVDIGWRGTIQDNLAHVLPEKTFFGHYLGLARVLNEQPANARKYAFGPDLNLTPEASNLLDAVAPLEMLSNSPHGSVEGYRPLPSGRIEARRLVDEEENSVFHHYVSHFQAGVLHAAQAWSEYLDNHAVSSAELRPQALAIWNALVTRTPEEMLAAYSALSHNEVFGVGQFVDQSAVPSMGVVLRSPFVRRDRHSLIQYIRQSQWAASLKKRTDLNPVHRALLHTAVSAGKVYKYVRVRWQHRQAKR